MKLQFRIPDEDEDEHEAQPSEPPDTEDLIPKALTVAVGAAATQVLWPLPVAYLVLFALAGAVAGVIWLLRISEWGTIGMFVFFMALEFLTPAGADAGFILRTLSAAIAAFAFVIAGGVVIQRRLHLDEGQE